MKRKSKNQSKNKTLNFLRYLGPGLLVTVGFIDPGNWASNIAGLYHWHEDGVHSVIMLYKAEKFIGELKSSEEGQVYWIPLEELKTRELATGMKYVLQILGADQVNECYMHLESEGYVGDLY